MMRETFWRNYTEPDSPKRGEMDTKRTKKWIETRKQILKAEADLESLKAKAKMLEDEILEEMAGESVDSVKVDGITCYVDEKIHASIDYREDEDTDEGYERVCAVLDSIGLSHIAQRRFNLQTLTKHVREMLGDGDELPPELVGAVKVSRVYKLIPRGLKGKVENAAGSS